MTTTPEISDSAIDLAAKTLTGDIRDWHLSRMRTYKKPWEQMSEREQRDEIDAASRSSEELVRNVTRLVAANGFSTIDISCGALKLKDNTIKCEITARYSDDNLIGIAHAGSVVMVLAKPEEFYGQRAPAKAAPDQPDLMDEPGTGDAAEDQGDTIDEETGEILSADRPDSADLAADDDTAAQHQDQALADAGADLGPEARENAERLAGGIRQIDESEVERLEATPGDTPKRRGKRRSAEERTAANQRAAESSDQARQ